MITFREWLRIVEDSTQLTGTAGTQFGDPTPSGSAPKNKVTYPGNSGCSGGSGKCDPPKAQGCSGGPCPPRTTVSPQPFGSAGGGGAVAGGAAPAGAQAAPAAM